MVSVVQGQNGHKGKNNNNKKQMHRGHFYLIIKKSIKQFVNGKGFLVMDAVTFLPCSVGTHIDDPGSWIKRPVGQGFLTGVPGQASARLRTH